MSIVEWCMWAESRDNWILPGKLSVMFMGWFRIFQLFSKKHETAPKLEVCYHDHWFLIRFCIMFSPSPCLGRARIRIRVIGYGLWVTALKPSIKTIQDGVFPLFPGKFSLQEQEWAAFQCPCCTTPLWSVLNSFLCLKDVRRTSWGLKDTASPKTMHPLVSHYREQKPSLIYTTQLWASPEAN